MAGRDHPPEGLSGREVPGCDHRGRHQEGDPSGEPPEKGIEKIIRSNEARSDSGYGNGAA